MREGFKNWLLIFSIVSVAGIILYFAVPQKTIDDTKEILGVSKQDYKYAPYIVSVAPVSTKVQEEFEYEIQVSDLDSSKDRLSYYLTEKPMWMYIEEEKILGVPMEVGTYKYVVSVSDGVNSTSQVNYILVEDE
jgi:hypothetical protein